MAILNNDSLQLQHKMKFSQATKAIFARESNILKTHTPALFFYL